MQTSTKALIYSAFIFPGSGYFLLKRKATAYSFLAVSLFCCLLIGYNTVTKARLIAEQLANQLATNGAMGTQSIAHNLNTLPLYIRDQLLIVEGPLSASVVTSLTVVLVLSWLAGIAGCYYQGKHSPK